MKFKLITLVAALAAVFTLPSSGAVVALYNFSGSSLATADADTDSTASDLVFGAGFSPYGFENRDFWTNTKPSLTFNAGDLFSDATVQDDDYISLTITPDVAVTGLAFSTLTWTDRSGGYSISVASSADSFATILDTAAAGGDGNAAFETFTLDISSLSNVTSAVEFRLYFHNGGGSNRVLDNITVNATVVPEPSTALLLIGGLTGLALLRRKRQ
jgi:hypothetical protein